MRQFPARECPGWWPGTAVGREEARALLTAPPFRLGSRGGQQQRGRILGQVLDWLGGQPGGWQERWAACGAGQVGAGVDGVSSGVVRWLAPDAHGFHVSNVLIHVAITQKSGMDAARRPPAQWSDDSIAREGAAMSDYLVRSAASTPEALHAIIVDAFNRGDVGAFLAAHEEGASVIVPPDGTYAHGLDEIRAATAPIISLRPHMTSVVYKTLRSNELALTHASWDLDGTAPDSSRTRLSGTGTIVSRRGPDGIWRIVLDDPQSGATAAAARVIYGRI
jgi:ketosteroid isomerase-like protein